MTLAFYLDDNVERRALVRELSRVGIDVIRATDVGNHAAADSVHLAFAARAGRVLVTIDSDFQRIHWEWMAAEQQHAGLVIVAPELSIGQRVRGIDSLNRHFEPDALCNQLLFLKQWTER